MQWRDIATAPKDGTRVLVYGEFAGEVTRPNGECEMAVWTWTDSSDHEGFNWNVESTSGYAAWLRGICWQPLPPPPPATQQGEG